jgi:hypothetical protein
MKATSLSLVLLPLLVAAPAAADSHKAVHHHKASRGPTAMHSGMVHSKTTSTPSPIVVPAAAHHEDAAPAHASKRATEHGKRHGQHAAKPKPPCLHEPITVMRGVEEAHFALTKCDGTPLPVAVDELSILARPGSAVKPAAPVQDLVKVHGANVSPGIKRVDPKLLERLQLVADHFGAGHPVTVHVISGYRPTSLGSFHASAQALDFRLDGVRNEELVAFCKTLQDTGCGYYPNSTFIHMDVRSTGTGHVSWIDASGPGEAAHYVSAWPPPQEPPKDGFVQRMAKILPDVPVDEHPANVAALGAAMGDAVARAN